MKVFLIIVGILAVLEIISKALDIVTGKKALEIKIEGLEAQLNTANGIIEHNNKVISEMARNANQYTPFTNQMQWGYGCEPKAKVSQEVIDAVRYAMKKSHPDNGGNAEDFMRFKKVYEEVSR